MKFENNFLDYLRLSLSDDEICVMTFNCDKKGKKWSLWGSNAFSQHCVGNMAELFSDLLLTELIKKSMRQRTHTQEVRTSLAALTHFLSEIRDNESWHQIHEEDQAATLHKHTLLLLTSL